MGRFCFSYITFLPVINACKNMYTIYIYIYMQYLYITILLHSIILSRFLTFFSSTAYFGFSQALACKTCGAAPLPDALFCQKPKLRPYVLDVLGSINLSDNVEKEK